MRSRTGLRFTMSVLAVAFGLVAGAAYAQGTKKVINALTITSYPPFSFKDPASNKLTGFDIDAFNAMAAKMGAEVNWVETSFDQLISFSALKTKRVDINGSSMGDAAERRASVNFLDHVYEGQVFYTLRANAERFPNVDAVCGKRVAVTRSSGVMNDAVMNWSEENCVKAGKPAVIVMGSENSAQSQQMLNQGRVDASLSGAGSLAYQNTIESNRYAILGKPVIKVMYGMGFRKDDLQFGEALKKALAALIADGTYVQLLRKWHLTDDASIERPMINGQP
ncbi:ABC transporter substrate-binding protein [Bradyrhizobium uaiense]|uniref:ABC transporter substrate-binding protein n=1 Tax=Bradyrhizobium uaiense TaxID=2594946 RepID=A0A6P1BXP7_9BRAD|nr:ABC transporter substrate-binding protein [Bradyrhizobium uaiense]NEV02481.1 ABC transporter substrate-binding protein [Bradyrhizobium uaiense]